MYSSPSSSLPDHPFQICFLILSELIDVVYKALNRLGLTVAGQGLVLLRFLSTPQESIWHIGAIYIFDEHINSCTL